MFAFPKLLSVKIGTCQPNQDLAFIPIFFKAMDNNPDVICSPDDITVSYSETSNVLVISPEIIVSHSKFKRLNKWLEEKGVLVEKVDYSNVSKMSGLFRCSTLPLTREL